jgi:hypothetical protein
MPPSAARHWPSISSCSKQFVSRCGVTAPPLSQSTFLCPPNVVVICTKQFGSTRTSPIIAVSLSIGCGRIASSKRDASFALRVGNEQFCQRFRVFHQKSANQIAGDVADLIFADSISCERKFFRMRGGLVVLSLNRMRYLPTARVEKGIKTGDRFDLGTWCFQCGVKDVDDVGRNPLVLHLPR